MKKRLLTTLLAFCMVLALLPTSVTAYANGSDANSTEGIMPLEDYLTYGDLAYTVENGEITIRNSRDRFKEIIEIPAKIDGMPVTSIGGRAFQYCTNLNTVIIPDSVTSIGSYAFYECASLSGVTIPDGVTRIEEYTFFDCKRLTQIKIPDNVTSIGEGAFSFSGLTSIDIPAATINIGRIAFRGCSELSEINVDASNASYISIRGVLIDKSSNTLVSFPGKQNGIYKVPDSVVNIGENSFSLSGNLTCVTIPSSVTTIETAAFQGCNLNYLIMSDSVVHIDESAFRECANLSDVYYSGNEDEWKAIRIRPNNSPLRNATIHYNSTGPDDLGDTGTQTASGVLRSGDNWKILWECSWKNANGTPTNGKVDITMTGAANRTDDLYIYNENSDQGFPWELAPHNIPKSAIETLSISGELTGKRLRIAANSFQGYSNLETVLLDDVTGIDSYAFEGCSSLKSVAFVYASELTTIGKGAFKNCTSLSEMEIPGNLTHIGDEAFQNTALGTITLGRSVTEIGSNAFSGCRNLKIRCYDGSVAHRYAQENNIPFELLREQLTKATVPFSIAGKTVEMEIPWNPDVMFSRNSSVYNHDLAVAGLALSGASENGESSIAAAMSAMGFPKEYQVHLGYHENKISQPALSIAAQKIILNGREKTLVALVVRGTTTNEDALTDIRSVTDGFYGAGRYAIQSLEGYLRQAFPDEDVVLFITGHSLGAAAAGYAANAYSAKMTSGNVFAYLYACPRNQQSVQLKLGNLHVIINEQDLVPLVPPNYWARIGTEYLYTTKNNASFVSAYKEISGIEPILNNPIDEHLPGTYMALLLSGKRMENTESFGHRLVRVLCPVDVEVYNGTGDLVGRVANNLVDPSISSGDVFITVLNDEKYIYLLEDEAYSLRLTGTASGTLDYSVQDFAINGTLMAEKNYLNVSLAADKELLSDVGGVTNTPSVQLLVLGDNGEPEKKVLPDGNGTEVPIDTPDDPTTIYTITLDANGGSLASTSLTTNTDGNLSSLPTPVRSGYSFSGWYLADGTRVTTNTVFATSTTIYARWTYISSSSDSSSGGDYSPPTYRIAVPSVKGGTVKVRPTSASKGSTVTITTVPNTGYELTTLSVSDKNGKKLKLSNKGDGKYTFVMSSGKVSVDAAFQLIQMPETPWSNPFTDVATDAWYYDAVKYVSQNGLMNGYGSSMFAPDTKLSRGMLAQILYNKEGRPSVANGNTFEDVADGAWYANAVSWAVEQNIVSGYGNGTFGPDNSITREQLAVILWRYTGSPKSVQRELHFTDAEKISSYALDALRWAVENGIINGKGDDTLDPQGSATRAQVAQVLMNYLEK